MKQKLKDKLKKCPSYVWILLIVLAMICCFVLGVSINRSQTRMGELGDYNYDSNYMSADGVVADEWDDMSVSAYDLSVEKSEIDYTDESTENVSKNVSSNVGENTKQTGMIHYDSFFSIETLDFVQTLDDIQALVHTYGATIVNSYQSDYDDSWYRDTTVNSSNSQQAEFEIRVPSDEFQKMSQTLDTITGKIITQEVSSVDMTRNYNSNNDRIDALETEREQLLKLMEQAENAETLIAFYDHVADINTELASLQTNQNDIVYDTDYATMRIHVKEVYRYTDVPVVNAPFYERLMANLNQGWDNFVSGMESVVLFVAIYWFVFVGIIIVGIVVLLVGKHKKRRLMKQLTDTTLATMDTTDVKDVKDESVDYTDSTSK